MLCIKKKEKTWQIQKKSHCLKQSCIFIWANKSASLVCQFLISVSRWQISTCVTFTQTFLNTLELSTIEGLCFFFFFVADGNNSEKISVCWCMIEGRVCRVDEIWTKINKDLRSFHKPHPILLHSLFPDRPPQPPPNTHSRAVWSGSRHYGFLLNFFPSVLLRTRDAGRWESRPGFCQCSHTALTCCLLLH